MIDLDVFTLLVASFLGGSVGLALGVLYLRWRHR